MLTASFGCHPPPFSQATLSTRTVCVVALFLQLTYCGYSRETRRVMGRASPKVTYAVTHTRALPSTLLNISGALFIPGSAQAGEFWDVRTHCSVAQKSEARVFLLARIIYVSAFRLRFPPTHGEGMCCLTRFLSADSLAGWTVGGGSRSATDIVRP